MQGWQKHEGASGFCQQSKHTGFQTFSHRNSHGQNPERTGFLPQWLLVMGYTSQGQLSAVPHKSLSGSCRLAEKLFTLGQQPVSRKAVCYVRMLRAYSPGLEMETILVCSIDFLKCISSMVF